MLSIKGRIPIHIHPFFIIVALMIGWFNTMTIPGTAIWFGIITVSVLVHEYGHALTALLFGQTADIELIGLGGLTQRHGAPLKKWQEFIVILNGPCAGLLLSAFSYFLLKTFENTAPVVTYTLSVTVYVNLVWTILNLVPVQPLDGGHLFTIILQSIFGFRGVKIALFLSIVLATALSIFFFAIQSILAGSLFLLFAFESFRSWKTTLSIKAHDRNEELQSLLGKAEENMAQGNKDQAILQLEEIRNVTQTGLIFGKSSENLAFLLSEKGQYTEAYDVLKGLNGRMTPQSLLLMHQLSTMLKQWKEVVDLGAKVYRLYPQEDVAFRNAMACGALGDVNSAVGWLHRAEQEGARNLQEIVARPEFDSIRQDPAFRDWQQHLK